MFPRRFVYCLVALALLLRNVPLASAQTLPPPAPPEWLADAELTSICFVDADRGWAVGDRGAILHTHDGGRNWQVQRSPATCRLEHVQFLDGDNGWAVGGWTQPYTHRSQGVVLRTRDGGRSWLVIPELTLPALKFVKFFDTKKGWVVGDHSSLYPTGVFRTEDGGRTWTPVAKGRTAGWIAADFRDAKSGILAGRDGSLASTTQLELRTARTQNLGTRYLRRMILAGESGGWLVGDGGLLMTTIDSGFTWTAPAGELPAGATAEFDFRAVAAHAGHVWIAGAPGTCVFHSHDNGQTWQSQRTDQKLPIRSLTFVDENRGWAVGSLGMILVTRDGGQTWREQRSGGTRVALLGIFSEPGRVPLEVLAQQSAAEGYLGAVEILGRPAEDFASPSAASTPQRTHEALVAVGASQGETSWRFPLRQAGLDQSAQAILEQWNGATDGKAQSLIEEHLVRRIRTWRPEVILTENVSPRGENPLAHITNQLVLAAAAKAADATAYSDQITLHGLEAWKVKKVFSVQEGGRQGIVNIVPTQWSARLGQSLTDQAELGRSLLVTEAQAGTANIGLSLLVDHLPQESGRRDVFSGLALLPGGEARRELSDPPAGDLEGFARAAQKRHNVQQLIAKIGADESQGAAWLGQVDDLTKGLSERGAGEILLQLALRYHRAGKSESAAEVMNVLLTKHPQHPLADTAAIWLVQYYASGECTWRERAATHYSVRVATAELPLEQTVDRQNQFPEEAGKVKPIAAKDVQARGQATGSISTAAPEMNPAERSGRALAVAKHIERTRPMLFADPALRFPLSIAQKHQGQPRQAEKFFATLTANGAGNAWAACASAEQWLAQPTPHAPKKIIPCVTALGRPKLDGRLEDGVWKSAKPVSLTSSRPDDADWPAVVVLTFDQEFLYLAVSCKKVPGQDYTPDQRPRSHDADLGKSDRVELYLDIDRDYASHYTLAFDHRGFTKEDCFGDATWNPAWYVAAAGDKEFWTVEAAIPLAELSPKPPQVRDVWAIGVSRIVPNRGIQSCTQPAGIQPRPEGFGLMLFE